MDLSPARIASLSWTLFQAADAWPLSGSAVPLNEWLLNDVEATSSGSTTNYIHVKLFYHTPAANPNATLITLFMNIIAETMTPEDEVAGMAKGSKSTKQLFKYMQQPPTASTGGNGSMESFMMKLVSAPDFVRPYDRYFDRVLKELEFAKLETLVGATVKDRHTVIEKWPYRLKLNPGQPGAQPGAQQEFDRALCGGLSSKERYVEWKRIE
ncbi:uncharacterized protein J7T54_004495 [Emericellopsis cladophorae]|uniref:Uncharacterized protein n=1 Tax=Emericellopsis cladophorae TaxID=2686198 RepID=A0A9Q0BBT3_9HYPO|nr:uncharacterized protein J7T54_004495 [Emericellopsis cladophorae]KAI6779001.1 hypothetical protein J7T54_004495 [Emericellopsis cladophorae]